MTKAFAFSRASSAHSPHHNAHAHSGAEMPFGPALKQAVQQGQDFGAAHAARAAMPNVRAKRKRTG